MPRTRDLFDDSTMTFGEHLEVLRVHVWRGLIGLVIGVLIALFYGDKVIGILRGPINEALHKHNQPEATDDLGNMNFGKFLKQLFSGEEIDAPKPEVQVETIAENELEVQVSVQSLQDMLESIAPGTIQTETPEPAEAGEATAPDAKPKMVSLILKSDEIAMLKELVKRSEQPIALKVEEAFMTYIKISIVTGFVLASPWIFYQIWLFVAAGLYQHERKYIYIYLPMSLGLFLSGAVFCFYFVFPIVLDFLISFNKWLGIAIQPRLSEYISFALMLPVMFGISFQLPMIMLFLERIGIMTVKSYLENWRMAVLIISIASMLLTPSDPSSMLLMMFPLIILYFGGVLLCRFQPHATADPLA
jgi:sec-independent protein translocase protein TatC